MELIVISESKLKIMLTAPDMRHYELSPDCVEAGDEGMRRAIRHIFHDAREEIGFNTEGERLLVQLYTSREGGCEIFVTKLGPSENMQSCGEDLWEDEAERALLSRILQSDDEPTDAEPIRPILPISSYIKTRKITVVIDTLGDLLALCHRLFLNGVSGGEAYIERAPHLERFYLCVDIPSTSRLRLPAKFAYLHEYGQLLDSSDAILYLSEHATPLCAVEAIRVLGRIS